MKPIRRIDVLGLVGGLFTLVGGTFTALGTWLYFNLEDMVRNGSAQFEGDMDEAMFSALIGGIGAVALVLGLFLVARTIGKNRLEKRLVKAGRYVWAEVVDVRYDWSVRINDRPSLSVMLREDASDFGSREFWAGPFADTERLRKAPRAKVKVYIDFESDDYFVDMSTMECAAY